MSLDEFRCSKMLQDYWEQGTTAEAAAAVNTGDARSHVGPVTARRQGRVAAGGLVGPAGRVVPSGGEEQARDAGPTVGRVRRRSADPFAETVPVPSLASPRIRRTRPGRLAFVQRYCLYLMPIAAMLLLVGLGGLLLVPHETPAGPADKPATLRETVAAQVQPQTASAASLPTTVPATPTPLPDKMRVVKAGAAGVWLRPEPNPTVNGMEKKPEGAVLDILGQEADVDGQPWRLVRDDRGNVGWVSAQYLEPVAGLDQPLGDGQLLARAAVTARASRPGGDADTAPAQAASVPASAAVEFWLRTDPNQSARRTALILKGSSVVLVDSRAGEIIDRSLPSPAKWYLTRTPQGETGWAYAGWVRRDDAR